MHSDGKKQSDKCAALLAGGKMKSMTNYTEPNFKSSAVITIDTQCDTLDGQPLEVSGTSAALPNIKMILDAYREKGIPIVHIVR